MRHEITSQLASRFRSLVVTDLRRLLASAQSDEPSLGVDDFLKQLSYKMQWRGGELNFAHTPELLYGCSQCGGSQTSIRGSSESLCCNACGFESPLEANVAQNLIKLYGTYWASRACPGVTRRSSSKGMGSLGFDNNSQNSCKFLGIGKFGTLQTQKLSGNTLHWRNTFVLLEELNKYLRSSNPFFACPKIELQTSDIIQHTPIYFLLRRVQDNLVYI